MHYPKRFVITENENGTYSLIIVVDDYESKDDARYFLKVIADTIGYEYQEEYNTAEKRTIH